MELIFEKAVELLREGRAFVIAAVVESCGSTPRTVGAKMLILDDGSIYSTIGGGLTEGTAIMHGKEILKSGKPKLLNIDMSGIDPMGEDMICGGGVKVILCPVTAEDLPVFEAVCGAISSHRPVCYVIRSTAHKWGHFCVFNDGEIIGSGHIDEETAKSVLEASKGAYMHTEKDGTSFYVERVVFDGKVYILGGGHVSLEVAKIADIAGFRTVVLEDRAEFLNELRFPRSERILIPSFEQMPKLNVGYDDYLIIVTRGHLFDLPGLKWALDTPAKYIGMIGSVTKRDLLYSQLLKEGISLKRLAEVHSPIGIKIGGSTPAEIAVSIVAELISVRSQKKKR